MTTPESTTPVERAAEAVSANVMEYDAALLTEHEFAEVILTAALDRDEIARVLFLADNPDSADLWDHKHVDYPQSCPWHHQADALMAHLTSGGAR